MTIPRSARGLQRTAEALGHAVIVVHLPNDVVRVSIDADDGNWWDAYWHRNDGEGRGRFWYATDGWDDDRHLTFDEVSAAIKPKRRARSKR